MVGTVSLAVPRCNGLTSQQLSTHPATPLTVGQRRELEGQKLATPRLRWSSKAAACASRTVKSEIYSPSVVGRPRSIQFLKSKGSAWVMVAWENESHDQNPPSPPFPELLLQSIMAYGRKCPFGQFGSTVPTVPLSNLMSHLWPTCWGGQSGEKKSTMLWKPGHWYVNNTALITNPKYTEIWAVQD